jgi:hypothetical protein
LRRSGSFSARPPEGINGRIHVPVRTEGTPQSEDDEKKDEKPERHRSVGSSAGQAKEREREMEESGEENAA